MKRMMMMMIMMKIRKLMMMMMMIRRTMCYSEYSRRSLGMLAAGVAIRAVTPCSHPVQVGEKHKGVGEGGGERAMLS